MEPFGSVIREELNKPGHTKEELEALHALLTVIGVSSRCDKNFRKKLGKLVQSMGTKIADS